MKGLILDDGALEEHLMATLAACTGIGTFTGLLTVTYHEPVSTPHTMLVSVLATMILVLATGGAWEMHIGAAKIARNCAGER